MSRMTKRVLTLAASALTTLGLATSIVSAPTAFAAPAGNIVYTGDSYSANPDQGRNSIRAFAPQAAFAGYPSQEGCLQSPDNAPRRLSRASGAPVSDWSCTAQTSRTQLGRIHAAIRAGDLHAGTRTVVLAAGMNNFGPFGAADGVNILDPNAVVNAYKSDMRATAHAIRSVAPHAKIVVAGMLSVTAPGDMICHVNVIPNTPLGFPVAAVGNAERLTTSMQRQASQEIGAQFVDINSMSKGHDTCAPDAQRWVSGGLDTTTRDYHMNYHPSAAGSEFVAQSVARVV